MPVLLGIYRKKNQVFVKEMRAVCPLHSVLLEKTVEHSHTFASGLGLTIVSWVCCPLLDEKWGVVKGWGGASADAETV